MMLTVGSLTFTILLLGSGARAKNMALETNEVSDHVLLTNINYFFDLFLKHYTRKLVEEGTTQVQFGNFERRFSTRILSLDFEGAINLDNGLCGNLSTLHRTGDADMSREDGIIMLSTHLGLYDLKINFNSYDISLMGVHQKGKINVVIGDNSLWLKLSARVKPSCMINLTDFKLEKLENVQVDITNLGPFETLTDEITSWVINEVTMKFRTMIEEAVLPELSKAVKNADLCHYLPI